MRSSGDEHLLRDANPEEEGLPDLEDDPDGLVLAGDDTDDTDGLVPPRDLPVAALDFGVTAAEQEMQESLEDRVRREEPDVWEQAMVDEDRVSPGRLVQPDEGGLPDDVSEEVASGTDDVFGLSAEEEAVRIEPEDDTRHLGFGTGRPGYLDDRDD